MHDAASHPSSPLHHASSPSSADAAEGLLTLSSKLPSAIPPRGVSQNRGALAQYGLDAARTQRHIKSPVSFALDSLESPRTSPSAQDQQTSHIGPKHAIYDTEADQHKALVAKAIRPHHDGYLRNPHILAADSDENVG